MALKKPSSSCSPSEYNNLSLMLRPRLLSHGDSDTVLLVVAFVSRIFFERFCKRLLISDDDDDDVFRLGKGDIEAITLEETTPEVEEEVEAARWARLG